MLTAQLCIRALPHYRRDAFAAGLARCGYEVYYGNGDVQADVLIIWNRYDIWDRLATAYERRGKPVLVVENGYAGVQKRFAISYNYHNVLSPKMKFECYPRVSPLNYAPWPGERGDRVLVLPQRGIGPKGVAMPCTWLEDVTKRLESLTDRQIEVRPHPGTDKTGETLYEALSRAHVVVTWGSGAAIKAALNGIPVLYELPLWAGGKVGVRGLTEQGIESPTLPSCQEFVSDLTWMQWTAAEVAEGLPFWRLLPCE